MDVNLHRSTSPSPAHGAQNTGVSELVLRNFLSACQGRETAVNRSALTAENNRDEGFEMRRTVFENRKVVQIETKWIRVSVTEEGGHIAEILNKHSGVNPLWIPPWRSVEPSVWSPVKMPEFGSGPDAKLLAGIIGHSLCLDLFGPPSADEETAGVRTHGEAGIVPWEFESCPAGLIARCIMPLSQLTCERVITLAGKTMRVRESVENLSIYDRPIAWTQHVTLGPPFIECGRTAFHVNASKWCAIGADGYQQTGCVEDHAGGCLWEILNNASSCGGYRAFLMDEHQADSYFISWSPVLETALAYSWKRIDFPWLGIWDESYFRQYAPWNGRVLARGLEFGVSPFPVPRREMIERGHLLNTPTFRWIPAKGRLITEYDACVIETKCMPASLSDFDLLRD